jgi:hypothetical protein
MERYLFMRRMKGRRNIRKRKVRQEKKYIKKISSDNGSGGEGKKAVMIY